MADPQKALETQLANIEKRSGKSLAELAKVLKSSGLAKHGELRDYLKEKLAMIGPATNTRVELGLNMEVVAWARPAFGGAG